VVLECVSKRVRDTVDERDGRSAAEARVDVVRPRVAEERSLREGGDLRSDEEDDDDDDDDDDDAEV